MNPNTLLVQEELLAQDSDETETHESEDERYRNHANDLQHCCSIENLYEAGVNRYCSGIFGAVASMASMRLCERNRAASLLRHALSAIDTSGSTPFPSTG